MTEFDPSYDSSIPRQADISQDAIVILPDLVDTIDGDEDLSFMHKTYKRVKYTGQAAVLGLVISPANEAVRLPVAIAAQAHTNNSLVAGTVLGLSTFAFEFTGARNTASLMDTHRGGKVFEWLNDKKEKVLKGRKMSVPVEAMVGYFGGAAVVLAAKQAEDPTRTLEQNRRHGLLTSGWMGAVMGVQWMSGGNALQNPTPTNIGVALATTVGAYSGVKLAQSRQSDSKVQ